MHIVTPYRRTDFLAAANDSMNPTTLDFCVVQLTEAAYSDGLVF